MIATALDINNIDSVTAAMQPNVPSQVMGPDSNGEFSSPLEGALWMAGIYQIPQIPLNGKAPFFPEWPSKASTNPTQIRAWWDQYQGNFGSLAVPGKHFIFESDSSAVRERIKAHGHDFTAQLVVQSRQGEHRYYVSAPAVENIAQHAVEYADFSIRADGEQCVSPGSIHPITGKQYRVASSGPLTAPTPEEVAFWESERKSKSAGSSASQAMIPDGRRNSTLMSIAGSYLDLGEKPEQVKERIEEINSERCSSPLSEDELSKTIFASIDRYAKNPDSITRMAKEIIPFIGSSRNSDSDSPSEEDRKQRAEDWIVEERAKKETAYDGDEYPVRLLPKQPGPKWDDEILYGIAGDIVRKVSEHCESHPAGMLLDFLVSFGSILGRGPYFNINATKHFTNEFMCRVGDSSKSRKGTGRDAVDEVLKQIAPTWFSSRVISGFGSSEAIIAQIKDTTIEMHEHKGVLTPHVIHGVEDKRLYIREGELASVFVLTGKAESRADIVLRDGWDGKPLRNIVKGKTKDGSSNSAKCEEPHISISGDTTIHELRRKMPPGSDENGFGNRFIYVYVYRVKDCPLGGPPLDWSKETEQLFLTVHWAKQVKYVSMTGAARQWWVANYHNLEHEGPVGLAGKMTARAAAHLRRLAMIYALLDKTDQIDTVHFKAAKRLWDYCAESAVFIFGGATAEQMRIVKWIGLRQTATYNQVRDELYHRNKAVDEIKSDFTALVKNGMLQLAAEVYSRGLLAAA
jgi:hypothetical protein